MTNDRFVGGAWAAGSLLFFFDRHNGLAMSPAAIGTASALNGLWTVVAQLTLLGRIRRWLGISKAYKALTFGWILVWLLLPNLRTLLEWSETPLPQTNPHDPVLYPETRGWITSIGVNLMLSFVTFVGLSNSLLMVLINFSSPDKSALGAVNGMSTAVGVSGQLWDNADNSAWLESLGLQSSAHCLPSRWTARCWTVGFGGSLWSSCLLPISSPACLFHRMVVLRCKVTRSNACSSSRSNEHVMLHYTRTSETLPNETGNGAYMMMYSGR